VQPGDDLVFLDDRVEVREQLGHRAGNLGSDGDVANRFERSGGLDGLDDVSLLNGRLGDLGLVLGLAVLEVGVAAGAGQPNQDECSQQFFHRSLRPFRNRMRRPSTRSGKPSSKYARGVTPVTGWATLLAASSGARGAAAAADPLLALIIGDRVHIPDDGVELA